MINMQQLAQQAQQMQRKMKEAQDNLKNVEVTGTSGGGLVKITMNGQGEAKKISIDDSLMIKEEKDMLEDLIIACVNDAKKKVEDAAAGAMNDATGGIDLSKLGF